MKKSALLCGAMLLLAPGFAYAQESSGAPKDEASAGESSDIIVTAQRRSERLVSVPVSVNAISQQELEGKQINSVYDLAKSVTSLRFEGQAPVFMPTLRGVGTLVLGGSLDASVPVYMDGVYIANTRGLNFDLPNVNGIQVLKGPQGTLFGRNSTGGAILITTAEPSSTMTGRFKATYARFNDVRLQGYVSGPLSENLAAGVSVSYRKSDGYTHNIVTGSNNDAPVKMFNVRPDLLFNNHNGVKLRLIYEHNYAFDASALGLNNPDGYALLSQPAPVLNFLSSILGVPLPTDAVIATKPFETAANLKPVNENVSDSFTGILDVDLSDSVKLKNTVNYRSDTNDFKADADLSDKTLVHVGGLVYYKTFSEEITLNGKSGGLDWVLGGYYFNNKFSEGASSNIIFGAPLLGTPQKVQTQTLAAFADATYEITPGLESDSKFSMVIS